MKKRLDVTFFPALCAGLGLAAWGIRKLQYALAVDSTGRLISGHPLTLVLGAVCLAAVALTLRALWQFRGEWEITFPSGFSRLLGHGSFALGIALTVLTKTAPMPGILGQVWIWCALASVPCLAAAGYGRFRGQKPFFLTYLVPAVFLTTHMINHYQIWCSNPQLQDILFPLFATVALTIAAYQLGAFCEDCGSRRQLLAAICLGVFLSLAELAVTDYPWLYLGGALWAGTSLCRWEVAP